MRVKLFARFALIAVLGYCGPSMAHAAGGGPTYLSQGWSEAQRQQFYTTSQGSQMIPLDWFLALERPDSEDLFTSDGLDRFGYLPNAKSDINPNGLPVGFTEDTKGGHWLGITCAACHTSQIEYEGSVLRIDGGPTNADLYGFLAQLSLSLQATLGNEAKFGRFADKVAGNDPQARRNLRNQLTRFSAYFSTMVDASTPPFPWGAARTDAFGMIFNRVTAIDLSKAAVWQSFLPLEENYTPSNAPVSYPFLWGTSRQDLVQWNGIAKNTNPIERLGRNVGEALGVFGRINLTNRGLTYDSTVNMKNQVMLEEHLLPSLVAPQWPTVLGPIDGSKVKLGEAIYMTRCKTCHARVVRESATRVKVWLEPLSGIGTDPLMTTNVACRMADSGILTGTKQPPVVGHKLLANDYALNITANAVAGVVETWRPWQATAAHALGKSVQADAQAAPPVASPYRVAASAPSGCMDTLEVYRARPLDGIWATGPYLHNGSVPNLYQLLLPSSLRAAKFHVGSRSFDPAHVGFDTAAGPFEFDTSVAGNNNKGHEGSKYGTDLTEEERGQLLEFLKTL